ncbi:MAG: nuclear transport factor 2 family protein [Bacteroidales bacterium]|nr:nuclear transport factor 2 family protein [Bacteroidales bacterium]
MTKRFLTIAVAALIMITVNAQQTDDKEAIKKVIQTGYVDGLQNYGDTEVTKNCFYPGFFITNYNPANNQITHTPIYNWIESVEKTKASGSVPARKITVEFDMIDITGYTAMAKIRLLENGTKLLFTDYLLLYKFEQGWKIVQKTYMRH